MKTVPGRLVSFLDENGVTFETLHYPLDFTAQEKAADTHTPGIEFAKTVLVQVDERYAMAVLPAHHRVDLERLRSLLGARRVRLAHEDETAPLFPDCDVGAEPPFGNLYEMPVYLASAMSDDRRITFSAGTHEHVIRMGFTEFRRLARPEVLDFSEAP
jgi:Ala-tRNA(Pro) deacylase